MDKHIVKALEEAGYHPSPRGYEANERWTKAGWPTVEVNNSVWSMTGWIFTLPRVLSALQSADPALVGETATEQQHMANAIASVLKRCWPAKGV